jgi:hypothetical protein
MQLTKIIFSFGNYPSFRVRSAGLQFGEPENLWRGVSDESREQKTKRSALPRFETSNHRSRQTSSCEWADSGTGSARQKKTAWTWRSPSVNLRPFHQLQGLIAPDEDVQRQ